MVITKTGKVQGNIVGPRVTLEDGAKFKGSIDMDPSGAERASGSASQPQAVSGSKPMAVEDKPGGVSSKA